MASEIKRLLVAHHHEASPGASSTSGARTGRLASAGLCRLDGLPPGTDFSCRHPAWPSPLARIDETPAE